MTSFCTSLLPLPRKVSLSAAASTETCDLSVVAGPDCAACDQFNDGGECEFPRGFIPRQVLCDAAADFRQGRGEPQQPARLAALAHRLPLGMVAVLQSPRGVASDRLHMRGGVGGVAHVLIGGRNRQCGQTADGERMANNRAILAQVGEPFAPPRSPTRQLVLIDVTQS